VSATTIGALIGGAIDHFSGGDDSSVDGALKGAIVANVAKVVLPAVVTYAVGWAVLRGLEQARGALAGVETEARS